MCELQWQFACTRLSLHDSRLGLQLHSQGVKFDLRMYVALIGGSSEERLSVDELVAARSFQAQRIAS